MRQRPVTIRVRRECKKCLHVLSKNPPSKVRSRILREQERKQPENKNVKFTPFKIGEKVKNIGTSEETGWTSLEGSIYKESEERRHNVRDTDGWTETKKGND